jgi:hypothetical protein
MIRQYIEFLYPGLLFSETGEQPVEDRQVPELLPENCFGFRFKERQEHVAPDGEWLVGEFQAYSSWYYKKGEVYTLTEMKDRHRHRQNVIDNMVRNQMERVLLTRFGQWIPLRAEDVVLDRS